MIRIGLRTYQKINLIRKISGKYKKIYIFSYKKFWLEEIPDNAEQIEYSDIIMYKFFYRLLGEIDNDSAIVINECLRDKNRNNLTYNCLRHYLNQCKNTYILEFFPFIEDVSDFMSLLDFDTNSMYKGSGFSDWMLTEHDTLCQNQHLKFQEIRTEIDKNTLEKYKRKKEALFDNIGNKDPDTIPRDLHIFAGNLKKHLIDENWNCVARNARFKRNNVCTYRDGEKRDRYYIIDFPIRQIELNDFIKKTEVTELIFINSTLKVDEYYKNEFQKWLLRLEEFYAKAGVYTENS